MKVGNNNGHLRIATPPRVAHAKLPGPKLFRTWEIPRSGSKAKNGEEREKERLNNDKNNGQLRIATPPRVAHAKPPGPIETFTFLEGEKCPRCILGDNLF